MTNIKSIVNELWSFGFSLYVDGKNIHFKHFGSLRPSIEKFNYLKGKIKENKAEVIEYLETVKHYVPGQLLYKLYIEAGNRVGWRDGIGRLPDVNRVEMKLEQVWREAEDGIASIRDFMVALQEWESMVEDAVNEIDTGKGQVSELQVSKCHAECC